MKLQKKGFTLIELLIVIAIIGILSSIVLVSLSGARLKARDAERKSELRSIQLALESYFADNGTYIVAGSGSGGCGCGWFSLQGSGYTVSVAQALVNAGYFSSPLVDPSGQTSSDSIRNTGYMIDASTTGYTIYANLESPSAADIATQNNCRFSNYDGYHSTYSAAARINYCVSN